MKYPPSVSLSFKNWLLPASSFLQTLVPLLASFGLSVVVSSLSDRLRGFPANFSFTSPRLDLAADSCLPHARWDLTAIFPLGWDPAAFLSFINVRLDLTANYPLRWDLAALLSITNGRLYPAANYPLRPRGGISPPSFLRASAAGSYCQLSSAPPQWDLAVTLSITEERLDPTAGSDYSVRIRGGIWSPLLDFTAISLFTRARWEPTASPWLRLDPSAISLFACARLDLPECWCSWISLRGPALTGGVESHRADSALVVLPEDLWAYNSRAGDFLAIS
ncbi:hypothetical protein C8F04DRAFT_1272294 [Mycena alexandri]|uniref:Uncharacterized protein n=1 Tax=Mycena alexandri TaxID=1745969 RepID=A0AAD6S7S4_9AGAR|nr:hypothetical protein C8F04DRAFT_1272294 [Mycena alexandri]